MYALGIDKAQLGLDERVSALTQSVLEEVHDLSTDTGGHRDSTAEI